MGSLIHRVPMFVVRLDRVGDGGIGVLSEKGFFRFFGLLGMMERRISSRLMGE
jgi:hypothetical protein